MPNKRAVVAIGGNSLIKDKFHQTVRDQYIAAGETCWHIAAMIRDGWDVVEDAGRGWRRVVASPIPKRIVEEEAIKELIDAGFVVITVGGGGIPVIAHTEGNLSGVAAVIDKDYASGLLANTIGAEL